MPGLAEVVHILGLCIFTQFTKWVWFPQRFENHYCGIIPEQFMLPSGEAGLPGSPASLLQKPMLTLGGPASVMNGLHLKKNIWTRWSTPKIPLCSACCRSSSKSFNMTSHSTVVTPQPRSKSEIMRMFSPESIHWFIEQIFVNQDAGGMKWARWTGHSHEAGDR